MFGIDMNNKLKIITLVSATLVTTQLFAEDFSFDRPRTGFTTSITPVGNLAWEQSLPNVEYTKADINNDQQRTLKIQGDMLLRTGLANGLELRVGFGGPGWIRTNQYGEKTTDNGLGDVSVGLKKAIDLNDDRMTMALLAQAQIATGNDGFTAHDDIYTVASTVNYIQNEFLTTGITMRYEVQNSTWAVTAIPTLNYKFSNKWSGYSELVYRKQESENIQSTLATGVMYNVNQRMQLDANIGASLSGDIPDYKGGLGVSFLF